MYSDSRLDQLPQRLWSKNFILVSLINLVISLVYYMLITIMALYAVERFQATDLESGFAVSMFVIGTVIGRLITGQGMDIFGRYKTLIVSLITFVIFSILYLTTGTLLLLLVVRLLHGLAFGAAHNILAASVMDLIPRARRSEGTGWFGTATTISTAVGPFIAFQLSATYGYHAVFIAATVASISGLIMAIFVGFRSPSNEQRSHTKKVSFRGIIALEAVPISLIVLMAGLSYSAIISFLNGYAQQEGLGPTGASVFFLTYAAFLLASRLFVGPIHDRYGDNSVIYLLLSSFVIGLSILAYWPTMVGLVLTGVFVALGFGSLLTCLQSIAVSEVPENKIGTASSTFFLMLNLGTGISPILFGALLPIQGYSGIYFVLALVMTGAVVLYWCIHGRKPKASLGISRV